jgi:hypothetical protein
MPVNHPVNKQPVAVQPASHGGDSGLVSGHC